MEWTGQVYADTPTVSVQTRVEAPPEKVWSLVSDIHLMPQLSGELQEVAWLDDTTRPRPGGRFRGRSAHSSMGAWETIGTIVECEEPVRFAWAIGDPEYPSAVWRFTLRPDQGGTVVEQSAQLGPAPSGLSLAIKAMPEKEQKVVFIRLREFETGMKTNLAAIKQRAERET